jgi:hypothetical protein
MGSKGALAWGLVLKCCAAGLFGSSIERKASALKSYHKKKQTSSWCRGMNYTKQIPTRKSERNKSFSTDLFVASDLLALPLDRDPAGSEN